MDAITFAVSLSDKHGLGLKARNFTVYEQSLCFETPGIPFGFLYEFTTAMNIPFDTIEYNPDIDHRNYGTPTGCDYSVDGYRWSIPLSNAAP